jgi:O-acetyl-ADP-ribose deacetylase (regulator of RNase III)
MYYTNQNIFDISVQALVNPVNCKGAMGKGLAKEFKNRWPKMYDTYLYACRRGNIHVGHISLWQGEDILIINFPTKYNWRQPSKIEYIEAGLADFEIKSKTIASVADSVAFPMLGCGEGGLNWAQVQPLMEKYLNGLEVKIWISLYGERI